MTAPKPDRDALRRLATEVTRATDAHNAVWYSHAVTMHEDEEEVGFAAVGYTFTHDGESEHCDAAMHAAEACARYAENMSPNVVLGLLDELERAEAHYRFMVERAADEKHDVTKARLARAEEALRDVRDYPYTGGASQGMRAIAHNALAALSPTEPEGDR